MKKTAVIVIFMLGFCIVKAQTEVSIRYNSTYSGRNIGLDISKTNNLNEFGVGVRYSINLLKLSDDAEHMLRKRQFALNSYEHFGISSFYHRRILNNWKTVRPFLFFDFQTSYSSTFNRDFVYIGIGEITGFEYYDFRESYHGPFLWLEPNIGFGFKVNTLQKISIIQKIGIGNSFVIGKKEQFIKGDFNGFKSEISALLSIGISYSFSN